LRCDPCAGTPAVLSIGFNRFHEIGELLGYGAADQLLEQASSRLAAGLSSASGSAARLYDNFAAILTGTADPDSVLGVARGLRDTLSEPYRIQGEEVRLTASVGIAMFPEHGNSAEHLLRHAEWALRDAHQSGTRSAILFDSARHAAAMERLRLENALRRAIENGELELLYQPVVSLFGKVQAFEALLTWNHPVRGALAAGEFIPIAEQTGIIADIGCWVVEQACLAGAGWRKNGGPEFWMSVNVSARQFERDDFVDAISAALAMSGFPARSLELELTESCIMRDVNASARRMARLRELGVSIAIDDFGTGYSSLSYLHKLPVDTVKIDQSFLRGIAQMDGSLPVVQSIVRLAHGMRLAVVAEGVETQAELELIRLLGCDMAQGHLFGRMLHREEAGRLLAAEAVSAARARG